MTRAGAVAHAVEGNRMRLDGGAMFGNAPRALWERWHPPDAAGRIALATRAVLVDEGGRKVLLEAGVGAFLPPAQRERYGVVDADHVLLASLASLGVEPAAVDVVVLSHLHFDHAGGVLSAWREGAEPELAFPRARFVVGRTAFERARAPHPRDRASFVPGLAERLEASGRLHLAGPGEDPLLGPGYRLVETSGHTPGMLHAAVCGDRAGLFYAADLVPGLAWVHLPITTGYDRAPEQLVDEKAALFPELVREGTWLGFSHDPEVAFARLERDASGRYRGVPGAGPIELGALAQA